MKLCLGHMMLGKSGSRCLPSVPHMGVDVQNVDADFLVASSHKVELSNYLYENLRSLPNVQIYCPVPSQIVQRAALFSFNVKDIHPTDIATFLDQQVSEKKWQMITDHKLEGGIKVHFAIFRVLSLFLL
ncbi:uncharacterized protein LOC132306126 isoform X2 [Cornus florida]|uniref:uncharacterized protein LOC132306126 isoform X2 n=1 Tax=Cornus florida TaxID=4283 RepID=UPI00289A378D|nr:uncharacterized protein LOC132306126 isoform X2 [Cornus florida]